MSFRQTRPKWRCLSITHKIKLSISAKTPESSCQHGGGGTMILEKSSRCTKCSRVSVKPPVPQLKLGPSAAAQRSNRTAETGKNGAAAMVRSESRAQPEWDAVAGPSEGCAWVSGHKLLHSDGTEKVPQKASQQVRLLLLKNEVDSVFHRTVNGCVDT